MCDSEKEVEDLKTEENVETQETEADEIAENVGTQESEADEVAESVETQESETEEASTEPEDCEKKDLPEEPQYEILEVEELQRSFREKVVDFFKVKKHIVVTSVSAAVVVAGVIAGVVIGISVNKASKYQPAIVEAAETQTETQTHTQPESTEPTETEEEESTEEETFEVIENIMEKVVADSAVTQKEDPIKNRNNASSGEVIKPVSYVDNAVSGSVSVSSVKKSGNDIVYSLKTKKTQDFTSAQLDKCSKGSILVEENGAQKQYTGYIYETGTVDVTGGSENVVTRFLVKDDGTEASSKAVESASAKAGDNTQKESASNIEESSKSETESSTEIKTVSYIVMEVEAQIEYVYADGWQNIKGKNYYFEGSNAVTGWKNIDGVQYYFNDDGSQGSSLVIDVSTYNGDIDWYSVKASGINYAMIRVGYRGYETARLVLDKRFHTNMSQATAAGIKVGAYIVTQAVDTTEAVEEASFIISACSGYNISLPLAIDVESAGGGSGRGDKISSSQRTAVINAFAQTVRSCGYSAILYANKDWMNNRIYAGNVNCNVWLAQYNSKCTYTGPFTMWQFTEKARVNGISGYVDMSAWKH